MSEGLFGTSEVVTALREDARDQTLLRVMVGSRRVADVPKDHAEAFGIRVGAAWGPAMLSACTRAMELRRALRRCGSLLRAQDRSQAELREHLRSAGFGGEVVEAALAKLLGAKYVDDAGMAERAVERLTQDTPHADDAVRAKLEAKGIEGEVVEQALRGAETTELERAVRVARGAASRAGGAMRGPARWRRVLAALGRRGFAEDIAMEAATAVLGEPPEAMRPGTEPQETPETDGADAAEE